MRRYGGGEGSTERTRASSIEGGARVEEQTGELCQVMASSSAFCQDVRPARTRCYVQMRRILSL